MNWIKIDRDENGFATEECLKQMRAALPVAVSRAAEDKFTAYAAMALHFNSCPPRERCYRYWLHKNNKAKYSGMSFAPYIDEEYSYENEDCEMFKPIE